jgi:hypothetical protein
VYHGSASGLSTTDNWSAELNQASAAFGYSVAAAGDVNGDGYSDVVVGAYTYDNGQTDEGKAVLYCGNNGPGKYITLCQKRGDLNTMVVPALKTRSTSEVGFALMGRTFFGRSKVKAQFEVKPLGTSFDATGLTESSTWRSVGVSGVVIDQYINSLNNRTMYKWRARVRYRLSDGAPQPYGRWIYPKGNGGLGEADFQVSNDDLPLPVEMVSLGASVVGNSVELRWYTATEVDNYGFEIERRSVGPTAQRGEGSAGNGSLFTVYDSPQWSKVGFVQGSGTSTSPKEYSFIDENLRSGRYAYRIKQINLDGSFAYTDALEVAIGVPTEFSLSQNYPNPFNPTTTIEYDLPQEVKVDLIVYDNLGQEVKTLADAVQPAGYYKVVFDAKGLSSGMYYYRIRAGDFVKVKKLLFIK